MTVREWVGPVAFGAFVGAWMARAVFRWLLDLPGPWSLGLIALAAVTGAGLGFVAAQDRAGSG